jgi:hypothetical protein
VNITRRQTKLARIQGSRVVEIQAFGTSANDQEDVFNKVWTELKK